MVPSYSYLTKPRLLTNLVNSASGMWLDVHSFPSPLPTPELTGTIPCSKVWMVLSKIARVTLLYSGKLDCVTSLLQICQLLPFVLRTKPSFSQRSMMSYKIQPSFQFHLPSFSPLLNSSPTQLVFCISFRQTSCCLPSYFHPCCFLCLECFCPISIKLVTSSADVS
jgi:hypothetical protein